MPRSKLTGRDTGPSARTFPRIERIRRRADYVRIQGSGRKIRSPNLLAFVVRSVARSEAERIPSSLIQRPRLGITVSRRVGGAVVRNRVKRLIRETFRLHKLCFPQGFDVVVVARSEAARATFEQIRQEMTEIARRIGKAAGSVDV